MTTRLHFLVRDATTADLPQIVSIYNDSIPGRLATADVEPVTVEQRRAWFERHSPERRPLWVAANEQSIAGWLSFESFYGRPAYDATVELSVYVANAEQRRGIGDRLLRQALERAPSLGVKTALGFIFAHNEASLALFRRHGFAEWGRYPDIAVLDGVERTLAVLGRRIG
ncbi:MAG: N-acetyltransferase family protein [Steroidobacteraceae bacterium]